MKQCGMAGLYVATAHKPTGVTHAAAGAFTGPDELNLVVAKGRLVQVFECSQDQGLLPLCEFSLYGQIAVFQLFRVAGQNQDWLFVCTQRLQFCVLAMGPSGDVQTLCAGSGGSGSISQRNPRGILGLVDPFGRCMLLHLHNGTLKIIPLNGDKFLDSFLCRVDEHDIVDICFLYDEKTPSIGVLYRDVSEQFGIKTYNVVVEDQDVKPTSWSRDNVDPTAFRITAVEQPLGGMLVTAENSCAYFNADVEVIVQKKPSSLSGIGQIDMNRFLLSDLDGNLSVLVLKHERGRVTAIMLVSLGFSTIASSIVYLDNGFVFLGSQTADSQLVRLRNTQPCIELVDEFPNLGPIVDMEIRKSAVGGSELVTCSNVYQHGSFRVIRNGIGIETQAQVELEGIRNLWSLKRSDQAEFDSMLVQSFVSETRILALEPGDSDGDVELTELDTTDTGFISNSPSLLCAFVAGNKLVQILEREIRLLNSSDLSLLSVFSLNGKIDCAALDGNDIIIASGRNLKLLRIQGNEIQQSSSIDKSAEFSCLDFSPDFIVAGLWDGSVSVLDRQGLVDIESAKIVPPHDPDGKHVPRSVLLNCMDSIQVLVCGLGDGSLCYSLLDFQSRLSFKSFFLGTQPVSLARLPDGRIFACGDRPSIISSVKSRITITNVNLLNVSRACSFSAQSFPNCLAFSSGDILTIGSLADAPQAHIRKIALNEQPRRVCFIDSLSVFASCTVAPAPPDSEEIGRSGSSEASFIRLYHDQSFEELWSYRLHPFELCCAITSAELVPGKSFLIIGTAVVIPEERDPSEGRLLIFEIRSVGNTLSPDLVSEIKVKGAVYSIGTLRDGEIVCGINSVVEVFKYAPESESIEKLCSVQGFIIAFRLKIQGDLVLVGDVVRSVRAYIWNSSDQKLVELAREFSNRWTLSCDILNESHFVLAESMGNIVVLRKEMGQDDSRFHLAPVAQFHTGERINCFVSGSFACSDSESNFDQCHIFGCASGMIGIIVPLSEEQTALLVKLQEGLRKIVFGLGCLEHKFWRTFWDETHFKSSEFGVLPVLDGDLIESLLELPPQLIDDTCSKSELNRETVLSLVERLHRLH